MNPIYAVLESPHKWLILIAISLGAAVLGSIMMIAYVWPHWLERVWFYTGLALALYFASRAVIDWWRSLDDRIEAIEKQQGTETGDRTQT